MLYGITPWHIRMLIDDPWVGGRGMKLEDVAKMSMDQVLMALVDRKNLLRRRREMHALETTKLADNRGMIKGRSADGRPMEGRIAGKSKARQLMEAEEARIRAEKETRHRS